MSSVEKIWHLLPSDPQRAERLARALGISVVVAQLLIHRGLTEPEAAARFLRAPLTGLHDPNRLPGVRLAAQRLHEAARAGRRICVYGDYDVDGVTGTSVLIQALRLMGAPHEFHVPHRLEEGYGLNVEALRRIASSGASVVVTVDCGIASVAEAEEARRLGLELIVTDHHEPKEQLPDADVLVHPRLDGGYPFGFLSGAGVAFKLAWALAQLASGSDKVLPRFKDYLVDSMALVAMGTVADVVPLHDENRIFVRHGLARLHQGPSPGLKALLASAGLDGKAGLVATDVGFSLAPRLNAAGRLGSARLAVELLTTPSEQRAQDLARFLEEQNVKRQGVERDMYREAREQAEQHRDAPALVLASERWHGGMIGIVAGRLMEQFAKPVLMIALKADGSPGAGSGRSVPGFRLHEALRECGEHLLSHGGHATAAGFRIEAEKVDRFREHFCAAASRHFGGEAPRPRLMIDAEVPLAALTTGLIESMAQLEPYGAGNAQPLFLAGDLQVVGEPRRVGGGERHLSFRVRQHSKEMKAIAFGMGDRAEELMSAGGKCCLVFTPKINEWQGWRNVELEVRDLRPGPLARLE